MEALCKECCNCKMFKEGKCSLGLNESAINCGSWTNKLQLLQE